jgi:hypothetical protein
MAYNILSGNVGETALILSGSFSGAYDGDGVQLANVNHTIQSNASAGRIPFFDTTTADGPLGNQFNTRGDRDFTYNRNTDTLTLNGTGAFSAITLTSASSETAVTTKYLALNASNQIVLTSSGGGDDAGSGGGQAAGPTGSLQFLTGSNSTSGSTNLVFLTSSNTLVLTGTLDISGTISANQMNINVINKNVINLSASGDTKFGDTSDDTHQFTGSVLINGTIVRSRTFVTSTPYTISATNYFIGVDTDTIGAVSTINLPVANTLQSGQSFIIKDEGGQAQTHNIKITASAADLIDGHSEIFIESPFGALNLYTNGTNKFFIY